MPVVCRGSLIVLALAATCAWSSIVLADDAPPKVLGFERVYLAADGDALAGGQLLLGELNCTSCHQPDESLTKFVVRKPAPVLDSVGMRVKPQYLQQFLNDPQATKPGTTMPNVLAGLSAAERGPIVAALVHFLAQTGHTMSASPMQQAVVRGETLFHSVGCIACHDPRQESPAQPVAASISLGTPSRKYTLPGLTSFLQDPLAVRPGGRMPHLNLSASEARDIASFLLNDLDVISGLQYAYYEGDWEKLPQFEDLTPTAVGDTDDFDLSVARRRDHFALRFEGTLHLPQEGDYLFLIGSDDGSRLLIDNKPVVVNDGVHGFEQKRKKVKMTAGLHSVVVEYFELAGEESLQLDFEAPGKTQAPLATLLTAPSIQRGTAPVAEPFTVDPVQAAKGREYFATLGCAACHALKIDGSPVVSRSQAKPLAELATSGGCLDAQPAQAPRYGLSARQQSALSVAIGAAKQRPAELSAEETVQRTLVRFNCLGCHERGKSGGVPEARNALFQSDMPEMGDEGRIPPSLTGVGAKLNPEWIKTVFDEGAKDRPYMFTRMPKFGLANIGQLVAALDTADAALRKPAPPSQIASEDEKRYKAAGRRLVGAQGFSCIKCHTFGGQRSSGIQALSLTTMTQRLRPDWFYHYLQNPLTYRPGTRMPTAFPDGQTTLPKVLDGTINGQIAAIWNYLADGDKATYPVGLVTGKIELIAFDEAVIYRNFIEGAGTRAVGVGYPEKLNLAFDANEMRLALLWHGGFIDAARHWSARGQGFEKPLGDKVLRLPGGPALAILPSAAAPWPEAASTSADFQFEGYRLGEKQRPTFLYSWRNIQIEDESRPVGDQDLFAMQRTLRLTASSPPAGAWFRALRAASIEEAGPTTYRIDGKWTLTLTPAAPAAAAKPLRRQQDGEWELLVPVVFRGHQAKVELTYDW